MLNQVVNYDNVLGGMRASVRDLKIILEIYLACGAIHNT